MLPKCVSVCVCIKLWLGGKSEVLYRSFHTHFVFHIHLLFQPLQHAKMVNAGNLFFCFGSLEP